MQTVSAALQLILDGGINSNPADPTRDFATLYEFYDSTYIPPSTGFDPASAVKRYAHIQITWNGLAYEREAESRSDTSRFFSKQFNSASVNFSNVDRSLAAWVTSTDVEGMWLVIREVSQSVTNSSIVLFAGRVNKPVDFDRINAGFSAQQNLGNIEIEVPSRLYSADDPDGRVVTDPLFHGFRIVALHGSFDRTSTEVRRKWIFFRKTVTIHTPEGWSSRDATPLGSPVQECFGRVQAELTPIAFADIGGAAKGLWVASNGKISAIDNIRNPEDPNRQPNNVTVHLGDPGGTGTNSTDDQQFPGAGKFSDTAYIGAGIPNGDPETVEDIVTVIGIVRGRLVPLPDGSGVFSLIGWTDSGPYLTRFLLTDSGFGRIASAFINDLACVQTATYCAEPLEDLSNSERILVANTDLPQAGISFRQFRSTGRLDSRYVRVNDLGLVETSPELLDGTYEGFDETNLPTTFTTINYLRRRYTTNFLISQKIKLVDLIYDVVLRSFRGYLVNNARGQIEIRSERAADNALLKSASIVGATSISVDDVQQWKQDLLLRGKVVIGAGLAAVAGIVSTETRLVTSAVYNGTLGNAVTLVVAVTGGVTATRSGATLSGGSTTVQSTGTVTIGGSPAAGNTVTVTIDGIAVIHTLDVFDTASTVARLLMYRINANQRLKRYIVASWDSAGPTVVTIKSKLGTLNLDQALAYAHAGPIADPTTAPTLTASSGLLAAGLYYLAYSYETPAGETLISSVGSVTLTANQKIDVGAITPPVGTTVNWYLSSGPGSADLIYIANNSGGAFSINALPVTGNPTPPLFNSTAEEVVRVMMSFSSAGKNADGSASVALIQSGLARNNIVANSFKWPQGGKQSSINQAIVTFTDAPNDFAKTELRVEDRVRQAKIGKVNPLKIDGSAIDNYHQAFRIASAALAKNSEGNWFGTLTTNDPNAMLLEEGDLFSVSDESGGFINVILRLEEARVAADRSTTLTGRLYSTEMFSDYVRAKTINLPTTLKYVQTINTLFVFLDIPIYRESDASLAPGVYIPLAPTAGLGDWRGAYIYSDQSGAYVPLTQKIDTLGVIGTASTALTSTTNTHTFDSTSTVRVQIKSRGNGGATYLLQSSTESKLLNGANLCAIGVHGRWELCQFQTVTPVVGTTDSYDLTVWLRGRRGTENNTSNHTNTDTFVLLTDADGNDLGVTYLPLDLALLNKTFNLKLPTVNQDVTSAVAQGVSWTAQSRRPLSIVNPRGTRDSANNLLVEFEGRARVGGGLRSYQAGATNEETELYKVQILNSGSTTLPNGKTRIMDVVVGMSQAASLVTDSASAPGKFDSVNVNTLSVTGSNLQITAHALQDILQSGNFVEATLSAAGDGAATLSLRDKGTGIGRYSIFLVGGLAAGIYVQIGSDPYNFVSNYPTSGTARVRILLIGSEAKFYLNYMDKGTPPLYVAPIAPVFPLTPAAVAATGSSGGGGGTSSISQMILTTYPYPKTIYQKYQQDEDFLSIAQASVQMDIWQESPSVGKGIVTRVTL